MTTIVRYFLSGINADILDMRPDLADFSQSGEKVVVYGSNLVNTIYAAPGVDLDARNLLGGMDVVFFSYNWSQYTKSLSTSGAIVFTSNVGGLVERVTVSSGLTGQGVDKLIFADGQVMTRDASDALIANLSVTLASVANSTTSVTSSNPGASLPTSVGATVYAFGSTNDSQGAVFLTPKAGMSYVFKGTSEADKLYITAGATVDARRLLGGEDQIFLTGNWSDYVKSLATVGSIKFTRTINGVNEEVLVSSGITSVGLDKLVFADGAVITGNAYDALTTSLSASISSVVDYDAFTIAPGTTDISTAVITSRAGVDKTYAIGDVIEVTVAMLSAVTVSTVAGTPYLNITVGSIQKQAVFDAANSTSTALKFKYTVASGDTDTNGISASANGIVLNGGTITVNSNSAVARLNYIPILESLTNQVDGVASSTVVSTVAFSDDVGVSSLDFKTNSTAQTITGTLSASTVSGEFVQVSIDGGTTWVKASNTIGTNTFRLSGQTLTSSSTLKVRVLDGVSNIGAVFSQAYQLDVTAPTVTAAVVTGVDALGVAKTATLSAGDKVVVTLTLSESVSMVGSGSATVEISLNGYTRLATLVAPIASSSSLKFSYTVVLGDSDTSGGIATGAISLPTGLSFIDVSGNRLVFPQALPTSANTVAVQAFALQTTATVTGTATDDVGTITTDLNSGNTTDDTTLDLSGTLSAALSSTEVLTVYDGANKLGQATVINSGPNAQTWTYLTAALTQGVHNITVRVEDSVNAKFGQVSNIFATNVLTIGFTNVQDNEGAVVGAVLNNATTDDLTPTLSGTLTAPLLAGEKVSIYNGSSRLGDATIAANGLSWSWTSSANLSTGSYVFSARAETALGAELMRASTTFTTNLLASSTPTTTVTFASTAVDGEGSNQDSLLAGSLAAGVTTDDSTLGLSGTISAVLATGERLAIYDKGTFVGTGTVTGSGPYAWTYTTTALSNGDHKFNARVENTVSGLKGAFSDASVASNAFATNVLTSISAPAVSDNVGLSTGLVSAGGTTDDQTPTLTGTLGAKLLSGEKLGIYNGATRLGDATIGLDNVSWSFTPSSALSAGDYSFVARVDDGTGTAQTQRYVDGAAIAITIISASIAPTTTVTFASTAVDGEGSNQDSLLAGSLAAGVTTDDSTLGLSGTISAVLATGERLAIYDKGTFVGTGTVTGSGPYAWTYTTTALSNGDHKFNARVENTVSGLKGAFSDASVASNAFATNVLTSISAPAVSDNVGLSIGLVSAGGTTDDQTPTLTGTLGAKLLSGEKLGIYNGATRLGDATIGLDNVSWSFTPSSALSAGDYSFVARVDDGTGTAQTQRYVDGAAIAITIISASIAPTTTVTFASTAVDGEGSNQDSLLAGSLAAGVTTDDSTLGLSGTISAVLATGERLAIYDKGTFVGTGTVTGSGPYAWTYTTTALSNGDHKFNARVENTVSGLKGAFSDASVASNAFATNVLTSISAPAVSDNVGLSTGLVSAGGTTDDQTPTLTGTLGAKLLSGEKLGIYNGATRLGDATIGLDNVSWSFTPSRLTAGLTYVFSAKVEDVGGTILLEGSSKSISIISNDPIATTVTLSPGTATDNVGITTTELASNTSTDDTTLGFDGLVSNPLTSGEVVAVYDGDTKLGTFTFSGTSWSYVTPALTSGTHSIKFRVENTVTGEKGALSSAFDTNVISVGISLNSVTDDVGAIVGSATNNSFTDDYRPVLSGSVGSRLLSGEQVGIYNGSSRLGTATMNADGVRWTWVSSTDLPSAIYAFNAKLETSTADILMGSSSIQVTLDNGASAANISATISGIAETAAVNSSVTGNLSNNTSTDATTLALTGTLNATLARTQVVGIYDTFSGVSTRVGNATVTGASWAYSATSLLTGAHSFTAQVENVVTGASQGAASSAWTIGVQTLAVKITDNVGTIEGTLLNGATTDDNLLTLSGSLGAPLGTSEVIAIYDTFAGNSTKIAAINSAALMGLNWSFTPVAAMVAGAHSFQVAIQDSAATSITSGRVISTPLAITISSDVAPTTTVTTIVVTDDASSIEASTNAVGAVATGTSTDDTSLTLSGRLSAALSVGEVVQVFDGANLLGTTTSIGTTWTFQTSLQSLGSHTYSAQVTNIASGLSSAAQSSVAKISGLTFPILSVDVGNIASAGIRYVLIEVIANTRLAEISVISDGVNVAQGKAVTVGLQSYASSYGPISNLTDGNSTTNYIPGLVGVPGSNWVQVDLGNYYQISSIVVKPQNYDSSSNEGQQIFVSSQSMARSGVAFAAVDALSGVNGAIYVGKTKASGSTFASQSFVVDQQLSRLSTVIDTTPTVSGTLGASLGTDEQVRVYVDGVAQAATATVSGTSWRQTLSAQTLGTHTIRVQVEDNNQLVKFTQSRSINIISNTSPTTVVSTLVVTDDVGIATAYSAGNAIGSIAAGTSTDDTALTLSGSLSALLSAGEVVQVYDGATLLGTATPSGTTWVYQTTSQSVGSHTYSAQVLNTASGLSSAAQSSEAVVSGLSATTISVDTGLVTGGTVIDTTPTLSGTLGAALGVGERVRVYVDGVAQAATATVSGTSWRQTLSAQTLGAHTIRVQVEDASQAVKFAQSSSLNIASSVAPTTVVSTLVVTDDVGIATAYSAGNAIGSIAAGTSTDDTALTLSGSLSALLSAGEVVQVYDGATLLGTATPSGTTWVYQTTSQSVGSHTYSAQVLNTASGLSSAAQSSEAVVSGLSATTISVDTGLVTGSTVIDTTPTLSGTLGAALGVGERVRVYVDGVAQAATATVSGTSWRQTLSAQTLGAHTIRVQVEDASQAVKFAQSSSLNIASSVAPTTVVSTLVVTDDVGIATAYSAGNAIGSIAAGTSTDDTALTLSGSLSALLSAGEVVQVYDGATLLGTATPSGTTWVYQTTSQSVGSHTYSAQVLNTASGLSSAAQSSEAVVSGLSATTISVDTGLVTGSTVIDTTPTLSGTLGAALGVGERVRVYVDGVAQAATATVSGTSWRQTLSAQTLGAHTIRVQVEDASQAVKFAQSSSLNIASSVAPTTVVSTLVVTDDVGIATAYSAGNAIGSIAAGTSTDDTALTLSGSLSALLSAGEVVQVYDGATLLGTATPSGTTWVYQTTSQSVGSHTYSAQVLNTASGLSSAAQSSEAVVSGLSATTISVDTGLVTGSTVIDTTPTLSGTLGAALGVGERVRVYVDGVAQAATATVSGTSWRQTLSAQTLGAHTIRVQVEDASQAVKFAQSSSLNIASSVAPTTVVSTLVVTDDVGIATAYSAGNAIGSIAAGTSTDDTALTLSGSLSALLSAGEVVQVYDGATLLGTATPSGTTWVYQTTSQSVGSHTYSAQVLNTASGLSSAAQSSEAVVSGLSATTISVDTGLVTGSTVIDTTPTLSGTLGAALGVGERVRVYVDGVAQAATATVSGTSWRQTLSAQTEGAHTIRVQVEDASQVVKFAQSSSLNIASSVAPTTVVSTLVVTDDVGIATAYSAGNAIGSIAAGTSTDDTALTLSGSLSALLSAGEVVQVYDGATLLGTATPSGTTWVYQTTSQSVGSHTYSAQVLNTASGLSSAAQSSEAVVSGLSATTISVDTGLVTGSTVIDTTPTLSGTLGAALGVGERVRVYVDGVAQAATATVSGTSWRQTLSAQTLGAHTIRVQVEDASQAVKFAQSSSLNIASSVAPTTVVSTLVVTDDVGIATAYSAGNAIGSIAAGTSTDDTALTLSGSLSALLSAGEVVQVYDGATLLGTATPSGTTWVYQTTSQSVGSHTYSAQVLNTASGLSSAAQSSEAVVSGLSATTISVDTGLVTGSTVIDTTPTLSGTLGAALGVGERVRVYVDGVAQAATATVSGTSWRQTLSAQTLGAHTIRVQVEDASQAVKFAQSSSLNIASSVAPTTVVSTLVVTDDVGIATAYSAGNAIGSIAAGTSTDDTALTLSGSLSALLSAGEVVQVYDGATLLGTATPSGTTWVYQTTSQSVGSHTYSAQVLNTASGLSSAAQSSEAVVSGLSATTISVDTGLVTGSTVIDTTPTLSGTLGAALGVGERVRVYVDGVAQAATATVSGTSWRQTLSAQTEGAHTIRVQVEDASQVVKFAQSSAFTYTQTNVLNIASSTTPTTLVNSIVVTDNVGVHSAYAAGNAIGEIANGASTDDKTLRLSGDLTALLDTGEVVQVYDGSTLLGKATVTGLDWSFQSGSRAIGSHTFSAKVVNTSSGLFSQEQNSVAIINSLSGGTDISVNSGVVIGGIRYIKVFEPSEFVFDLYEIKVMSNGVNRALASMGATIKTPNAIFSNEYTVSNVIDGNERSFYVSRSYGGWLQIDLGAIYSVDSVTVIPRFSSRTVGCLFYGDVIDMSGSSEDDARANGAVFFGEYEGTGSKTYLNTGVITPTVTDRTPTINGALGALLGEGERIKIYIDGVAQAGTASVSGLKWSQTLSNQTIGQHIIEAHIEDEFGEIKLAQSSVYIVVEETLVTAVVNNITVTDNVGIQEAYSAGNAIGAVATGTTTDDKSPKLIGTVSELLGSGEIIQIYDGSTYLGSAAVAGLNWTFQVNAGTVNSHLYSAKVYNTASGLYSAALSSTAIINTLSPIVISISAGRLIEFATIDTTPTISGSIGTSLGLGDQIRIYVDGIVQAGTASVYGLAWSYSLANQAIGDHQVLVQIEDVSGRAKIAQSSSLFIASDAVPLTSVSNFSLTDNVGTTSAYFKGNATGLVSSDTSTDDQSLTLNGNLNALLKRGEIVQVFDGVTLLGLATVVGTKWSYQTVGQDFGVHDYSAKVINQLSGLASASFVVSAHVSGMGSINILSSGSGDFDSTVLDTTPTLSGTLAAELGSGEVVRIYVDGVAEVMAAQVTGTSWIHTLSSQNLGVHEIKAQVEDASKVAKFSQATSLTIASDLTPSVSVLSLLVTDNVGASAAYSAGNAIGLIGNGKTTDDTSPSLSGTLSGLLSATEVVHIYDGYQYVGDAIVTGTRWTFELTNQAVGQHVYSAKVTNKLGFSASAEQSTTVIISSLSDINFSVETGGVYENVVADQTPTVSGSFGAELGSNERLRIYVDGVLQAGSLTVTGNTWKQNLSTQSLGRHILKVQIEDLNGIAKIAKETYLNVIDDAVNITTIKNIIVSDSSGNSQAYASGNFTGIISSETSTDDITPTISGQLTEILKAGEVVSIYDRGSYLGAASTSGTSWIYQTIGQTLGTHTYSAKVENKVTALASSEVSGSIIINSLDTPSFAVNEGAIAGGIRYILLSAVPYGGTFDMGDPQVYSNGINRALASLGASITTNISAYYNITPLSNLIDGNVTSYYFGTAPGVNGWYQVDLGGIYSVESMTFNPRSGAEFRIAGTQAFASTTSMAGMTRAEIINSGGMLFGEYQTLGAQQFTNNSVVNMTTSDSTPTVKGTLGAALGVGDYLKLYVDDIYQSGAITMTGLNWSQTLSAQSTGTHIIKVQIEDINGKVKLATSNKLDISENSSISNTIIEMSILDNIGTETNYAEGNSVGYLSNGETTDDDRLTFVGTTSDLLKTGEVLQIKSDNIVLGYAKVNGKEWSYEAPTQQIGSHTYTANIINKASGLESAIKTVSAVIGSLSEIQISVDQGFSVGDSVIDSTPTLSGTFGAMLASDEHIKIFVNGIAQTGVATVSGLSWTKTLSNMLVGEYAIKVQIENAEGSVRIAKTRNLSVAANSSPVSTVAAMEVIDDQGVSNAYQSSNATGSITTGTSSDDLAPVIRGRLSQILSPGEGIEILDGSTVIATLQTPGINWSYQTESQSIGSHTYSARVTNLANGRSSLAVTSVNVISGMSEIAIEVNQGRLDTGTVTDVTPTVSVVLGAAPGLGERVRAYVNGVAQSASATGSGTNWSINLNTQTLGTHSIKVQLEDGSGNIKFAQSRQITIASSSAPTVVVLSMTATDRVGTSSAYVKGNAIGLIANQSSTDDLSPILNGTLSGLVGAGEVVQISEGLNVLGLAIVSGTDWSYQLATQALGSHVYTAKVLNISSLRSSTSQSTSLVINNLGDIEVSVNVGNLVDDVVVDNTPTLSGLLGSELGANDTLKVYVDNVEQLASVVVTGTTWNVSLGVQTVGAHTIQVQIEDVNGKVKLATSRTIKVVANNAPVAVVTSLRVIDDVGVSGEIAFGTTTDDLSPKIEGSLSGLLGWGEVVSIFDGSLRIGTATVNGRNWSYQADQQTLGAHTYKAAVENLSNNLVSALQETTTIIQSLRLSSIIDTEGLEAGNLLTNVQQLNQVLVSDDTSPVFLGRFGSVGVGVNERWVAYVDGVEDGAIEITNTSWKFTPVNALALGDHTISIRLEDATSHRSKLSLTQSIKIIDNVTSPVAVVSTITAKEDNGQVIPTNTSSSDTKPLIQGTLSQLLQAGEQVLICSTYEGVTRKLGYASTTNLTWSYLTADELAVGTHAISAKVIQTGNGLSSVAASTIVREQILSPIDITPASSTLQVGGSRYIMVRRSSDYADYMSLADISVITSAGIDVSKRASITSNLTATKGDSLENLIDGNINSYFASANKTFDGWIQIDLGGIYNVSSVSLRPRVNSYSEMSGSYVFISKENLNTKSLNELLAGNASSITLGQSSKTAVDDTGDQTFRYTLPIVNTTSQEITVSGTIGVALNDLSEGLVIYADNVRKGLATVSSDLTWSFTLTGLNTGEKNIKAQVEDVISGGVHLQQTRAIKVTGYASPNVYVAITDAIDDVNFSQLSYETASATDSIASGSSTNDSSPTLRGTLTAVLAIGEVLQVFDGSILLGTATVAGTNWSFSKPSTVPYIQGNHSITAKVINLATGYEGSASRPFSLNIIGLSPIEVSVNAGSQTTSTGRYVMVRRDANSQYVDIREIEVWSGGVNIALGKQVSIQGNDFYYSGYDAKKGTDRINLDNNNRTHSVSLSNDDSINPWIQIDLGYSTSIDSVTINSSEYMTNSYVILSDKDMRGTSVATLLDGTSGFVLLGKTNSNKYQQQIFSGKTLIIEDTTPTVSGTISAPLELGEIVGIYLDGVRSGTASINNGIDWSYTLPVQTLGKHTVLVQVESSSYEMRLSETIDITIFATATQGISSFSAVESVRNGEVAIFVVTSALLAAGQRIAILDGANILGYADTLVSGEWRATLKGVGNGLHALTAVVLSADGSYSTGVTGAANITISHIEPTQIINVTSAIQSNGAFNYTASAIHQVTDIYKLWVTGDTTPSFYGKLSSMLNSGAVTGESIKVYDNGVEIVGASVSISGLDWTYTAPVLTEGQHALTFKVVSGVNEGVASSAYTIEVDANVTTTVQISKIFDTAGVLTGALVSGDTTDDAKWEISGTLSEAQTGRVELYDNDIKIATIDVLRTNTWTYNLDPLSLGINSITAKFVNTAGVAGAMSAAIVLTIGSQDGVLTPTNLGDIDAVTLSGADQMLDLTQIGVTTIDQVNLGSWGGNTLKLSSADVTDSGRGLFTTDFVFSYDLDALNASRYHQMLVTGSGISPTNSKVILADNVAVGMLPWSVTGTATKNSTVYDVYTNFTDQNQLLIQQGLVVL